MNHLLTKAGLIHSPEGDDENLVFEEVFAEYASKPESARELRDQYRELANLICRLERELRGNDPAPALAVRLRWLRARRSQGARNTTGPRDKIFSVQILNNIRNALPLFKQAAEDL